MANLENFHHYIGRDVKCFYYNNVLFAFLSAAPVPVSQWLASLVALNAVNMADMADSSLNKEIRVDIYIDCAIQLRSTLPKNLKFLAVSVHHPLFIIDYSLLQISLMQR
jgi:hypothetical protein